MNTLSTVPFTAFIGIDWADAKHDVCVQAADGDEREFDVIPHQVERIDEWAHHWDSHRSNTALVAKTDCLVLVNEVILIFVVY